jgi:hypothetical protein
MLKQINFNHYKSYKLATILQRAKKKKKKKIIFICLVKKKIEINEQNFIINMTMQSYISQMLHSFKVTRIR